MKPWKPYTDILTDRWAQEIRDQGGIPADDPRPELVKTWRKMGRVRPTRWAWALDGVSMSRAELLHCWGALLGESPRVPVWYFPGRGCWTTRDKWPKESAREVLTLRDFLQCAKITKEGDK